MSDFYSSGWSIYIAVTTVVSIIACLVLLAVAARRKVVPGAGNTTGHTWDEDLTELNNPLPRWWMWLFIITVVFGIAYLVIFPGAGSHAGALGWTSIGQYENEQAQAKTAMAPLYAGYAALDADDLIKDAGAMGIGERLFVNNCSACHGSDAHGGKGFPNLTDDDWLHGGSPEIVEKTITEGRQGMMPPLAAAVGSADDVRNVANFVLSLSGSPHDAGAAERGQPKFAICAACHGADGKGNQALGSPNLTDKVWLHGYGVDAIVAIVTNGMTNVMPAQGQRLSAEQIHVLAAYVLSLSRNTATTAR